MKHKFASRALIDEKVVRFLRYDELTNKIEAQCDLEWVYDPVLDENVHVNRQKPNRRYLPLTTWVPAAEWPLRKGFLPPLGVGYYKEAAIFMLGWLALLGLLASGGYLIFKCAREAPVIIALVLLVAVMVVGIAWINRMAEEKEMKENEQKRS